MSIFTGGQGYQGNDFTVVPPGGGSFKFTPSQAPVPGVYSGSCPGDPGCPGRDTEYTGQNGWGDVGKVLALKGGGALIDKYLSRPQSPGDRAPSSGSKGNMASSVEKVPSIWDFPSATGGDTIDGKPAPSVGNGAAISPAFVAVAAVILIAAVAFSARRA